MIIIRKEYIVRNVETKEPIQTFTKEQDAVNMVGYFNKKYNAEVTEVLKVVSTIEMTTL